MCSTSLNVRTDQIDQPKRSIAITWPALITGK